MLEAKIRGVEAPIAWHFRMKSWIGRLSRESQHPDQNAIGCDGNSIRLQRSSIRGYSSSPLLKPLL